MNGNRPPDSLEGRLLEGIKVVDLSSIWAAPLGTRWLADMGAEVLKVMEVPKLTLAVVNRLKRLRQQREEQAAAAAAGTAIASPALGAGVLQTPLMSEKGFTGYVLQTEGNKLAIGLDFETPKGRDLLVRLIKDADIVVDNHRPVVLERSNLDLENLRRIKPDIILLRVSAMGASGPDRNYSGFGATIDGLGGLAFHTGYHDVPDQPVRSGINYADPVAGMYAGSALMMALLHRHRTGQGQEIDMSLRETLPIGEMFMEYAINGRFWPRLGNREPGRAPHGVYRCAGDDRWIAIAVNTDSEWRALCTVLGGADWAEDARFEGMLARCQNHDALDATISARTRDQDDIALAEQAAGGGRGRDAGTDATRNPAHAPARSPRLVAHPR